MEVGFLVFDSLSVSRVVSFGFFRIFKKGSMALLPRDFLLVFV